MVWSEGVGPDGHITGLELSDEYAAMARKGLAANNITNVDIQLGNAATTLSTVDPGPEPFDVVFLDANKDAYPKYLELILAKSAPGTGAGAKRRLLRKGGLIVADNVLRRAIVADSTATNPHFVREVAERGEEGSRALAEPLRRFNDALVGEERLEAFLMPLFDGLGMARLRD